MHHDLVLSVLCDNTLVAAAAAATTTKELVPMDTNDT